MATRPPGACTAGWRASHLRPVSIRSNGISLNANCVSLVPQYLQRETGEAFRDEQVQEVIRRPLSEPPRASTPGNGPVPSG